MKKALKTLLGTALIIGAIVPTLAFANEQTINVLDGDEPQAEIIVNGRIGEQDNTIDNPDLPIGDPRWINVTLPTAVFFNSDWDGDLADLISPVYEIRNNSFMGLEISVADFENLTNAASMDYIGELNIFDRATGGNSVQLMEDGAIDIAAANLLVRMPGNGGTANDYAPEVMTFGFDGELSEVPTGQVAQPTFELTLTFESINRDGTPVETVTD